MVAFITFVRFGVFLLCISFSQVLSFDEDTNEERNQITPRNDLSKFRVRAGLTAVVAQFPMMALLQGTSFYCSGSLLDAWTVLTAAHCFCSKNNVLVNIFTGTNDEKYVGPRMRPGKHSISTAYNFYCSMARMAGVGIPSPFDLAVVKLMAPVVVTMNARPVKLSNTPLRDLLKEFQDTTERLYFVGYGLDSVAKTTYVLKYGSAHPLECRDGDDEGLCLDPSKSQQVPDVGDSGGPVLRKMADGSYEQVAVISGMVPMGHLGERIILADVHRHLGFIHKFLGDTLKRKVAGASNKANDAFSLARKKLQGLFG